MKQPEHDGKWWKCVICGEYLPEAPSTQSGAGIVQCKCDALYEFNYWMLNRWAGDSGNTGLEPRLRATPKGQVNVRMSRATREKLDHLTAHYGTQAEAVAVAIDRLYQEEEKMSDRLQNYFQHYAEEIAQGQSEDATCTIVEIQGTDCLYELCDGPDCWRGRWRDGESIKDIRWEVYAP